MLVKNTLCTWLLPIIIAGLLTAYAPANVTVKKRWVIMQSSSLCVNGSTNINKFTCEIPGYDQTDTLFLTKNKSDKTVALSGSIKLKILSFDCHNSIMTHDLRSTLKEKQFPELRINFLTLSDLPELTLNAKPISGFVNIELAGVNKRFEVSYQASVDSKNIIHLLGSRDINFSDFKLAPPRKLGGMIKTNDKLSVQFYLRITALTDGD